MGPPGSCQPQMGPMLAPWTLLSGLLAKLSPLRGDIIWTHGMNMHFLSYFNIAMASVVEIPCVSWTKSKCSSYIIAAIDVDVQAARRATTSAAMVLASLSRNIPMMTSSNGNIFRVTGLLCGEFTGLRWIPRTKANDAEFWCFSLICAYLNGWINTRETGDLRRYRAH